MLDTTVDPDTIITHEDPHFKSIIMPMTYSSLVDEVEAIYLTELKANSMVSAEEGP
jgi:hypothetical protein